MVLKRFYYGAVVVVSELVFSDDPSSNPSEDYSFSVNIVFEKNKNKEEEAGIGPYFKKGFIIQL